MFQVEPFDSCLPAHKVKPTRFGLGFFVGCFTTGIAFAAIVSSTNFSLNSTLITSSPALGSNSVDIESIDYDLSPISSGDGSTASDGTIDDEATGPTRISSNAPVRASRASQTVQNRVSESDRPVSQVLSQRVMDVLAEVQLRQEENQWEEALNELNALYTEYESLNSFEQSSLLNFYVNTLLRLEMWEEAIGAFTLMTSIPDLRPDHNARALLSLGQLHERTGNIEESIYFYESWLNSIDDLDISQDRISRVEELLANARIKTSN